MTDSAEVQQQSEQPAPTRRPWLSRLIEFGIWFAAPFGVMIVGIILALIFGATHQRVIGVFAAVALIAGAYFMWRPSTRFKIGRARAAGLLYTGLLALVGTAPTPPPGTDSPSQQVERQDRAPRGPALTPEQEAAQRAEREAQEAARREQEAAAAAAAQEARRTEYVARLERELASVTPQSLLRNTDTPDNIIVTVALFSVMASIYDDGRSLGLSAEQERARQRFKARVIELQTQVLPELRNRYGPAMSRRVWENDMEVRTIGTGYRTIEFIWGGFAANRNIAEFQRNVRENIEALRFRRVQYRWYRGADRYTYYDLETPSDRDLVVSRGGRMVRLTE